MTIELGWMRYEVGGQRDVLPAYEAALVERSAVSPLGGLFTVDVGVLNSAAEFFWYPDRAARDDAARAVAALEGWPLDHPRIVERSEPLVLEDAPFSPPLEPGSYGALYEIRQYEFATGMRERVFDSWGSRIEARQALSPFLGAWWGSTGDVEIFVHLWAYDDAAQRAQVRHDAMAAGIWPPPNATPLRQQSTLVIPAPFSPLR